MIGICVMLAACTGGLLFVLGVLGDRIVAAIDRLTAAVKDQG